MTEKSVEAICNDVIDYYCSHAEKRFNQYETATDDPCQYCLQFMTPAPANVLDVGSGSGRDAAFFASKGYQVTAVEPAKELREMAIAKHAHPSITWVDDRLPALNTFASTLNWFDHIHLSAVILHLPPEETKNVLVTIHKILKQGGTLYIGLRNGPPTPDRPMFDITKDWVTSQSENLFTIIGIEESEDDFKRTDVRWSRMVLKKI